MVNDDQNVAAHLGAQSHSYVISFPAHPPRTSDPHYLDFNHIHNAWKADPEKWQCSVGKHRNDFSECDLTRPLELHHNFVEFSLQNGVDLKWLETDFPGISDPASLGAWVESADNMEVLCLFHHRGRGGAHTATHADYIAEQYVRGLIPNIGPSQSATPEGE